MNNRQAYVFCHPFKALKIKETLVCLTQESHLANVKLKQEGVQEKKNAVEPGNWRGTRHCFTVNSASQSPDSKTTSLTENNKHFLCNNL